MFFTIIIFIIVLSVLVFVHELGHFWTARKAGVKVEEFGFGFPPKIVSFKKGETVYSINWIPIGGFVKLHGEEGGDKNDKRSFAGQSIGKRALIVLAGVIMNVLLAYFLLSVGYLFGLPSAVTSDDIASGNVIDPAVQISSVVVDSPADQAGLAPADKILAINGQAMILTEEVQKYIVEHQELESINLTVLREQETKEYTVSPAVIEGFSEQKAMGVALVQTGKVRYGLFGSLYHGGVTTVRVLGRISQAFYELFVGLLTGQGMVFEVSGPVGVAVITSRAANLGFMYLLQFTAMFSLNLAILNILPFPALDGGRLLFLIIEKFRGRPNNEKIENLIHNIGFSLLMLLVIIITYQDIIRFGGGFLNKVKNILPL